MQTEYFSGNVGDDEYVCQYCGGLVPDTGSDDRFALNPAHECTPEETVMCSLHGAFGIIVPQVSADTVFTVQSNGHLCEQRPIRGQYIPLSDPLVMESSIDVSRLPCPDVGEDTPLYNLLTQAVCADKEARDGGTSNRDYVWELIEEELPFNYEETGAPDGYLDNVPAWQWIRITETTNSGPTGGSVNVGPLVGEQVLLVYPNFD